MTRTRALVVAASGLALHALLLAGVRPPPWPALAAAFTALVLLPGFAFVALGARPPGSAWLSPPWALGFGVAWNALFVLATRALHMPFTALVPWLLPIHAVLWLVVAWRAGRPAPDPRPRDLHALALALILLAATLAAWHAGRLGTPVTVVTDSPDHIGTIRRMLEHGDAFPRDAFFRDAGSAGADPRKGLWHPQVALIARLSGLDPYDVWRMLPGLVAPLFVLAAAGLGMLVGGSASAAVAAWALLLTYGGSLAGLALRETQLATKLADQLALATAVAALADLRDSRLRNRLAALGLGLGAVAAHLFSALHLAATLGALVAGLVVRDRGFGAAARRLTGTAAWLGIAALPYLLWRAQQAYGPVNPIHTEPQGLLTLWDGVRIVLFGVLWDWFGGLWVLVPLAWWSLWRHGRSNAAVLFLLTSSLGVALVIFNPLAVALLEPRVGYLLRRFVWLVPMAGLLAWLIPGCVRGIRSERGRARLAPAAGLALTAVLVAGPVRDAALVFGQQDRIRAAEAVHGTTDWHASLRWLDRELPPGRVVLADPATSYAVPMLTRHYVVTLVDQHSSPNDSLALRRILDSRDALDPYGSWERTREVVERYRVDLVVLNGRFRESPLFDYWAPSRAWFVAARARFDAGPLAFERLQDEGDWVVYRVKREGLARLAGGRPRPFAVPYDPRRSPIARRLGPRLPALQSLAFSPRAAAPGDSIRGVAEWRALEPLPVGSYRVAVRFDRPLPGGFSPPVAVAKPLRKLLERARGERYRFRADHLPVDGAYGVDLWTTGEVVRDTFRLVVPRNAASGAYQVRVQMLRQPHYTNLRLSDYFSDRDLYAGVPAGVFVVARPGERPKGPWPDRGGH